MKIVIFVLSLMVASLGQAHEQEELTETQQELQMLQQDLSAGFERISLLQNTILKKDVEPAQKCGYIQELKSLVVQVGYMIDQFENVKTPASENFFGDDSATLRLIFAEQMRSRLVVIDSVIPTYQANSGCN
jgi:hypothetical protein